MHFEYMERTLMKKKKKKISIKEAEKHYSELYQKCLNKVIFGFNELKNFYTVYGTTYTFFCEGL